MRIPGTLEESPADWFGKPVVLIQHGLIDNARGWFATDDEHNLPFKLAKEGYDVWLLNSRGTIESFEHVDPKKNSVYKLKSEYWRFSWD